MYSADALSHVTSSQLNLICYRVLCTPCYTHLSFLLNGCNRSSLCREKCHNFLDSYIQAALIASVASCRKYGRPSTFGCSTFIQPTHLYIINSRPYFIFHMLSLDLCTQRWTNISSYLTVALSTKPTCQSLCAAVSVQKSYVYFFVHGTGNHNQPNHQGNKQGRQI